MPPHNPEVQRIIIDGYEKGLPIRKIAELAGTTYDSCRTMASRLQLVHPSRGMRGKGGHSGAVTNIPWQPAPERVSPQYANWLRAKEGAAKALKELL